MLKKIGFTMLAFLLAAGNISAQHDEITQEIVDEGKYLYNLEMASWHGTDMFLEKHPDQRDNIGGYFSYKDGDNTTCLFFSK